MAASALRGTTATAATKPGRRGAKAARGLQAPRGDLRGEPQLRQPLRRLGQGRRPRRSTAGPRPSPAHTTQVAAGRARRTPACMQNDVNLDGRAAGRRPAGPESVPRPTGPGRLRQPLQQQAVQDRHLHQADRHHLPADRTTCSASRTASPTGPTGTARRLHPRPGAQVLPGAVPAQRRPAEPLRHRQRRGRPVDGLLRHQAAADLPLPARQGRPALRHRGPLLPGARSVARTSTTSTSSRPSRRCGARLRRASTACSTAPGCRATTTRCYKPTGRRRRTSTVTQACGLPTTRGRARAAATGASTPRCRATQPTASYGPKIPLDRRHHAGPQHR